MATLGCHLNAGNLLEQDSGGVCDGVVLHRIGKCSSVAQMEDGIGALLFSR